MERFVIIECPKCKKEKEIKFKNGLLCEDCKADISEFKYKKATYLSIAATLIIGAGSTHVFDEYVLSETRYPLEVENAIIDHCINGHASLINQETQKKMSQLCLCALSNTQKKVSYSEFEKDVKKFLKELDQQAITCKE